MNWKSLSPRCTYSQVGVFLSPITAFAECEYEMSRCAWVSTFKSVVSILLLTNVALGAAENRYYAHRLPACSPVRSNEHRYTKALLRCHGTTIVSNVNPVVLWYSMPLNDYCIHMGESHKTCHISPQTLRKSIRIYIFVTNTTHKTEIKYKYTSWAFPPRRQKNIGWHKTMSILQNMTLESV